MNAALPLLAALDENDRLLLKNLGRTGSSQMVIIFGSIGVIAVLAFLFVFIFRNRLLRRRKRHRHHHHHRSVPGASEEAQPKRRRWRRPRREHRPLNPTLAQTHGLPPVRNPEQPPPGL
jgi:hypothetical protein